MTTTSSISIRNVMVDNRVVSPDENLCAQLKSLLEIFQDKIPKGAEVSFSITDRASIECSVFTLTPSGKWIKRAEHILTKDGDTWSEGFEAVPRINSLCEQILLLAPFDQAPTFTSFVETESSRLIRRVTEMKRELDLWRRQMAEAYARFHELFPSNLALELSESDSSLELSVPTNPLELFSLYEQRLEERRSPPSPENESPSITLEMSTIISDSSQLESLQDELNALSQVYEELKRKNRDLEQKLALASEIKHLRSLSPEDALIAMTKLPVTQEMFQEGFARMLQDVINRFAFSFDAAHLRITALETRLKAMEQLERDVAILGEDKQRLLGENRTLQAKIERLAISEEEIETLQETNSELEKENAALRGLLSKFTESVTEIDTLSKNPITPTRPKKK